MKNSINPCKNSLSSHLAEFKKNSGKLKPSKCIEVTWYHCEVQIKSNKVAHVYGCKCMSNEHVNQHVLIITDKLSNNI